MTMLMERPVTTLAPPVQCRGTAEGRGPGHAWHEVGEDSGVFHCTSGGEIKIEAP